MGGQFHDAPFDSFVTLPKYICMCGVCLRVWEGIHAGAGTERAVGWSRRVGDKVGLWAGSWAEWCAVEKRSSGEGLGERFEDSA